MNIGTEKLVQVVSTCMWVMLAIAAVIGAILLIKWATSMYYARMLTFKDCQVKAKVVDKKHESAISYTTLMPVGKMLMSKTNHVAEKNYVSLRTPDEVHTVDDRRLYHSVEVGDQVNVVVRKGYDKHGILKRSYVITLAH